MENFSYQISAGQPTGPSFVQAGVTEDRRLVFDLTCFEKHLSHEVLVRLADAFVGAISETINEQLEAQFSKLDEAEEAFDIADQAIRRAQDAVKPTDNNKKGSCND